ncbi:MAG: D-alanyl-D-alanine carboxypeptidase family protein [Lachnospiraceae bacterium]
MYKRKTAMILSCVLLSTAWLSGCGDRKEKASLSVTNPGQILSYHADTDEMEGLGSQYAVAPMDSSAQVTLSQKVDTALLINMDTKEVVASNHAYKKIYPASMTKLLTALVVLDNASLNETVVLQKDITFKDPEVISMNLKKGDRFTVETLLNAMLVSSANDCAVALAQYIAGTEENFAILMNEKAKELGATHSHFMNVTGLHDKDHYTSAYDLYLIFENVLEQEELSSIINQKEYEMYYTAASNEVITQKLQSSNRFLNGSYDMPKGCKMMGGKTGTTNAAGYCLISQVQGKDHQRYIAVVANADDTDSLYATCAELYQIIL